MKLSTKGRYAMVALADLALTEAQAGEDLMSLAAIAKRQDLSLPYLEQLFVKLRRAGLVEAVRGPGGGYRLAKSPDSIRISEVMEAVEENVDAMHSGAGASGGDDRGDGSRRQSVFGSCRGARGQVIDGKRARPDCGGTWRGWCGYRLHLGRDRSRRAGLRGSHPALR